MTSKQHLVEITEAAQRFLRQLRLFQHHFGALKSPHEKQTVQTPYFDPLDSLMYFIDFHRAALAIVAKWTEPLRWEFAGLSTRMGIRVGAWTHTSAHEVAAESARMASNQLPFLMIDESFFDELSASFEWKRGLQSVPEGLKTRYEDYWKQTGHRSFFVDILWELLSSLSGIRPLRLRGTIDCEHMAARRGRGLDHASLGFPATHLSPGRKAPVDPFAEEMKWSPSSRPNVVRFVRAARSLGEERSTKNPLSLAGIYKQANLSGASQTRAKVAALRLELVSRSWKVTARGSRLLAEDAQVAL